MASPRDIDHEPEAAFVSTGHLPDAEVVQALVSEAYERFRSDAKGENSRVYPALAAVREDLFGVCVAGITGSMFAAGDADHEFTIMSVSKPFMFALVCELIGPEDARERLGVRRG